MSQPDSPPSAPACPGPLRRLIQALAALPDAVLTAQMWPRRCLVCRESCEPAHTGTRYAGLESERLAGADLCHACRSELPWLRAACARCARPLPAPAPACGHCLRHPPPQALTRAVFLYAPPLDRLLPRLKFHHDLAAGRSLALLMAAAYADTPRPQALVPVPLHPSRLRARGFDQTLELARPLARHLDLPLRADLLRRQHATAPQSRLEAAARRRNLRDAFVVPASSAKARLPAHVAVFDDVMTTGATVQSAATALLRIGVARVDVWVCARVG